MRLPGDTAVMGGGASVNHRHLEKKQGLLEGKELTTEPLRKVPRRQGTTGLMFFKKTRTLPLDYQTSETMHPEKLKLSPECMLGEGKS